MHELSLCKSIIKTVERYLTNNPQREVITIHLVIGIFSCVNFETLKFNFSLLRKNTKLSNVELKCKITKALAKCLHCLAQYQPSTLFSFCPQCDSAQTKLLSGNELLIKIIEVK